MTYCFRYLFPFCAVLGFVQISGAQKFEKIQDPFVQVSASGIRWIDMDGDLDLDLIYSGGVNFIYEPAIMKVYENQSGSFVEKNSNLPAFYNTTIEPGDFDNDGDFDLLIAGFVGFPSVFATSALYENNGDLTFSLRLKLPDLGNATASWFDLDNDSDLDFLVGGLDQDAAPRTFVYENKGSVFAQLSKTNLPPCVQCSLDWGDCNGDGKMDLLVTGQGDVGEVLTRIYINNGNKSFHRDEDASFEPPLSNGSANFGDFDLDGDLDVLVSGITFSWPMRAVTWLYERKEDGWLQRTDIAILDAPIGWQNSSAWLDYDGDGLLDIVAGLGQIFFRNLGNGSFENVPVLGLGRLNDGYVDFGDYDNDGDIDLCYSDLNLPNVTIYRNLTINGSPAENTKPVAPDVNTLYEEFDRDRVVFRWGHGSDDHTRVEDLDYNIYVRTGSTKVWLPAVDLLTGALKTMNTPNGRGRMASLKGLIEGKTYNWSVQSIDDAYAASPFSGEKSFYQINGPECSRIEIIDSEHVKLTWIDYSKIETGFRIDRSTSPSAGFTTCATPPANSTQLVDNFVFSTDTYYYYRISAVNAVKASGYGSIRVVIPTAPSDLELSGQARFSSAILRWRDNSSYETGYVVQRKRTDDAGYETVATLPVNTSVYKDEALSEGVSYDYIVYAINEFGQSVDSNMLTVVANSRPRAADLEMSMFEDMTLILPYHHFVEVYADPDDTKLAGIEIGTLPAKGDLRLGTSAVVLGQFIAKDELSALSFVPLQDKNGLISFQFFVNDGIDNSAQAYRATLNIVPVNDAPVVYPIPNYQIELTSAFTDVSFIISDPDDSPFLLALSASSSDTTLIGKSNLVFSGYGERRTLRIKHERHLGELNIMVTVSDGKLEASESFSIVIFTVSDIAEIPARETVPVIFPNPVSTMINVKVPSDFQAPFTIAVYDLMGRLLLQQVASNPEQILEVDHLIPGPYGLTISSQNGKNSMFKFLKE